LRDNFDNKIKLTKRQISIDTNEKLDDVEERIARVEIMAENLKVKIESGIVSNQLAEFQARVEKVEAGSKTMAEAVRSQSTQLPAVAPIQNQISEFAARERKKFNVFVHDVPASIATNPAERIEADRNKAKKILTALNLPSEVVPRLVLRAFKTETDNKRTPLDKLRIVCRSEDEKLKIIDAAKKFEKSKVSIDAGEADAFTCRIVPDRTRLQLEEIKKLFDNKKNRGNRRVPDPVSRAEAAAVSDDTERKQRIDSEDLPPAGSLMRQQSQKQ
jgi:hypothetical protein